MSSDNERDPIERLSAAYDAMMEQIRDRMNKSDADSMPGLKEIVSEARERLVALGELTQEEAEKLSSFIERDVQDAAHFIVETGQDFSDWFKFDWQLIEKRMFDAVASVADQTSLQLKSLADQARTASTYHSGDITGPGTLVCKQCGELMHFQHTHAIPPCPKCNAHEFRRWKKD